MASQYRTLCKWLIMVVVACGSAVGDEPEQPAPAKKAPLQKLIRISEKTTRITSPLDDEGFVDYVQAINDRCAKGATPQNNFEVVVRTVMGPSQIDEEMRAEYFASLGIPVPEGKQFYQGFVSYARTNQQDPAKLDGIFAEHRLIMSQPWRATDHPLAAKWVAEYGKDLDRLVEGSKRAKFYTPYISVEEDADEPIPPMIGLLLPSAQQQREVARGLSIRAMRRIEAGDLEGAWSDIQAIHRVARHVAQGATLIESLVGIAIDSMAFKAEIQILNSPNLQNEQTRRFLADLKSLSSLPPVADKIDTGERFGGLDAVAALARNHDNLGLLKMMNLIQALSGVAEQEDSLVYVSTQKKRGRNIVNALIDWNVTLASMNSWYDRLVAASREPNFEKRKAAFETIDQDLEKLSVDFKDPKQLLLIMGAKGPRKAMGQKIGDVLAALLLPAVQAVRTAEDRAVAERRLIQLAFTAELHRREKGALPASLARLVRLKESEDPHSGDALKYEVRDGGFVLFSVGRNGIDDGGRTPEDAGPRPGVGWDDIVVRVK